MSQIKWNGTPIAKLPTKKIKNIIQEEFAFDNTKNYRKFAEKSLNNKKFYYGTKGSELRHALQHELFKRRLTHHEKITHDRHVNMEARIDNFFSKIEKALI